MDKESKKQLVEKDEMVAALRERMKSRGITFWIFNQSSEKDWRSRARYWVKE